MKKRTMFISCLAAVSALVFSGCSNKVNTESVKPDVQETEAVTEAVTEEEPEDDETEPEPQEDIDYDEIYGEITEKICDTVLSGEEDDDDEFIWLTEMMNYTDSAELLNKAGYVVKDISGDGVPELIIGIIDDSNEQTGNTVKAVYTCADQKPVYVFSGTDRNSYSLLDDGSFFNSASDGAAVSIFGRYILSADGSELLCQEYYFTDFADEESEDTAFFSNTSGTADRDSSERLDITEEDFAEKEDIMRTHIVSVTFKSLSETVPEQQAECLVSASFADEELPENCEEFRVDYEDIASNTVFTANEDITDFTLLALSLRDPDNIKFAEMELYKTEKLEAGQSVAAGLGYLGTIPNNGISYTDENGVYHVFAVSESGEDGSLIFTEINEDGSLGN